MSFLEKLSDFFALAKESNFDIVKIYAQDPNAIYALILAVLLMLLIIIFFIRRSIKISSAVKLVSNMQNLNDFNEYDTKLTRLASELPKRGLKLANSLNSQKNDLLQSELNLIKDFNIKEKINKYKQISSQYALIAKNSKKFKNSELTSFYEEKSKTLLDDNLAFEIEEYSKNTDFNENDIEFINSIISYSETRANPEEILTPLINEINKFSYSYNLEFFKFVKALDKEKSSEVYKNCNEKLNECLKSTENRVSNVILSYLIENDEKQTVYSYISNLKSSTHLQDLYYGFFAKTEDIELDLAFVANEVRITNNYSDHIDCKITENWADISYIKHIIESPRVLETIGHISYRNVLERIERLQKDEEVNKAVNEAIEIAKRAENIAIEAKELAELK